jgi:hypothetical protein
MKMTELLILAAAGTALLAAAPVDVALTLDTSPGTEQAIGLLRGKNLQEDDRAAVITVSSGSPRVLLSLSEDRDALASALQRAGVRVGAGMGGISINDNLTVHLAGAIKLACKELSQSEGDGRAHAIVVLFGSPDPELGSQMQTVKAALDAAGARLYAVQIDRASARAPDQRRNPLGASLPTFSGSVITAQLMSELAEYSRGRMYRQAWDLKEILQHARKR